MAKKRKTKETSKAKREWPWRTIAITGFLFGAVIVWALDNPDLYKTEKIVINDCEFPPNPVIGDKNDLEVYITKNKGFFKGTSEPFVLDFVPEQARLEQMRTATLCAIIKQFPDMNEDRALCWQKTINLPVEPSDLQLDDAQKYCLKDERESEIDIRSFKRHRGMLSNLQRLLRKDSGADFSLMLGPQDADQLSNIWIRRTSVLGGYADLIEKICDNPLNACLFCDIREIERRAEIKLNGPTEVCQHRTGEKYLQCAGTGTNTTKDESILPFCEP